MEKIRELLALRSIKGIGKQKINKKYVPLIQEGGLASDVIKEEFTEAQVSQAYNQADSLLDRLNQDHDITVITVFDPEYPQSLDIMGYKKPPIIFVKGSADKLHQNGVAVVGTRSPSAHSMAVEPLLVKKTLELSPTSTIISGLAVGCDRIAHETTIRLKKPTIAVLPSGVNVITPPVHKDLANDILNEAGCILSEYMPWESASRYTFVERDALVAALSRWVISIECARKSGTMHTLDHAVSYKKKVGCYIPKDLELGNYEGNLYMVNSNNAFKLSDTPDLAVFLQ